MYTTTEAIRITGVGDPVQVNRWIQLGVLRPTVVRPGKGGGHLWSAYALEELRLLGELRAAGVELSAIAAAGGPSAAMWRLQRLLAEIEDRHLVRCEALLDQDFRYDVRRCEEAS